MQKLRESHINEDTVINILGIMNFSARICHMDMNKWSIQKVLTNVIRLLMCFVIDMERLNCKQYFSVPKATKE